MESRLAPEALERPLRRWPGCTQAQATSRGVHSRDDEVRTSFLSRSCVSLSTGACACLGWPYACRAGPNVSDKLPGMLACTPTRSLSCSHLQGAFFPTLMRGDELQNLKLRDLFLSTLPKSWPLPINVVTVAVVRSTDQCRGQTCRLAWPDTPPRRA